MNVGSVLSGPVDERRIGSLPQVTVVGDGAAVVGDGAASENAVSMVAHGCRRRRLCLLGDADRDTRTGPQRD